MRAGRDHPGAPTSGRAEVFAGGSEAAGSVDVYSRHVKLVPPAGPDVHELDTFLRHLRNTNRGQRSGICGTEQTLRKM